MVIDEFIKELNNKGYKAKVVQEHYKNGGVTSDYVCDYVYIEKGDNYLYVSSTMVKTAPLTYLLRYVSESFNANTKESVKGEK